ncbi:MAG: hypothetical protein IPM56_06515 [Ignavibacteriales bacterium]|nr:MAG: hypothetical protein IPM56_06515 [Ignavibacteriales bacterium]
MIPKLREEFNSNFNETAYNNFLKALDSGLQYPTDFRVSETPLFLSKEFSAELQNACAEIINQIKTPEFIKRSNDAVPASLFVPNEDEHPLFLQIDFAICEDGKGGFIPQLIELQGFPSLYCFQAYFADIIRNHFNIPEDFTSYFSGYDFNSYVNFLEEVILDGNNPENVILLEIEPEKQKTRIDFAATEKYVGIKPVCITKITKKGNKLFYNNDGHEIQIKRIYNRVIFDELIRKEIKYNFDFKNDLDISWAGHPNWFFRISKFSLPLLKNKYSPSCFFLNELNEYPADLKNYVLKPLFSFAGSGVEVDVTKELLDSITDRSNYILQKKIEYAPLIKTPDGYSKVEIRMMFLWKDEPLLVNNLIRMSKGKMMGVDFNKNKTWVGSSVAFHPVE